MTFSGSPNYKRAEDLYVFFCEDIKNWKISGTNYIFNINKNMIDDGSIKNHLFDDNKIELMKDIIKRTTPDVEKEMYKLLILCHSSVEN